jgi:hypothetical protein
MSGTAKVKPPKNAAEHTRNTQRRIESLENPTSQRVGDWVLSTGENGELLASHVNGGSVQLAAVPIGGEENPDDVSARSPVVKVQKAAMQALPANVYTPIIWDVVDIEYPSWGTATTSADRVLVPEDGVYLIILHVVFPGASLAVMGAAIRINGALQARIGISDQGSGSSGITGHPTIPIVTRLATGDVVEGLAINSAGLPHGIDSEDFSFLALVKI